MATPEDESFWIEKTKQLSQGAIETLVRDVKIGNQDGLFKPQNEDKSVRTHRLELDEGVEGELLELQQKGIDVNELLKEFLEKRKQELAEEKERLEQIPTKSHYIPVRIRRHLQKEHSNKCSIEHCQKPATTIHHTQRFALSQSHNPKYLAPLCKEHHAIAHAIDAKVQVKINSS